MKSRKTDAEIAFVREAMAQDGQRRWRVLCLAGRGAGTRRYALNELDIDREITAARAKRPGYFGQSFSTIAGFNANGALPHYRATADSFSKIEGDGLLLIDSGGNARAAPPTSPAWWASAK